MGPRILWWLCHAAISCRAVQCPRLGWKGRPPFDVLIQASYLLVFVLSSWLNHAPQLPWQTFLFGALFAMHSHVFGEVMDIEPDQLTWPRTTHDSGRVPSKFLIAAFLALETTLVWICFRDWIIAGFLLLGVLWFLLDATLVWKERVYTPVEMRYSCGLEHCRFLGMFLELGARLAHEGLLA